MAANVYEAKREVYVVPFVTSAIRYGFLTNVRAVVSTDCGHTAVDRTALPAGLVFGANAPKPGRASRKRLNGTDSSYYDIGVAAALRQAGYSLSRPRARRGGASTLSSTVFVTIGTIKYAWRIRDDLLTRLGADAAALGISVAGNAEEDLVFGASFPKPPRASKVVTGVGGFDTLSTFIDPTRLDNLPEGWSSSNVIER